MFKFNEKKSICFVYFQRVGDWCESYKCEAKKRDLEKQIRV